MLASIVYSIILLRLQTRAEFEKSEHEGAAADLNYDAQLEKADVTTLNRAQRRARANYIMKRQRRVVPQQQPQQQQQQQQHNIDDTGRGVGALHGGALLLTNEAHHHEDDDDDVHTLHLSRKERQKAAKEAERMERLLYQTAREQKQKDALKEAQEQKRLRLLQKHALSEEQRKQYMLQKELEKKASYEQWRTFLASDEERMTVVEFITYAKENKKIDLQSLSERFRISLPKVQERMRELIKTRRVSGIITSDLNFIYLTQEELGRAAQHILATQEGTFKALASDKSLFGSFQLHDTQST
jgi:hypothetical protein